MKHLIWVRYILMACCVVVILMGWLLRENVDLLLRWMYTMLGIGAGAMLLMSLFSLAQNPKSAVQSLIGLVAILVILGISFSMASSDPVTTPTNYYDNVTALKVADGGLYATYALLALSIISIILGEIRNAFK